jgi:hypothetical protein
VLGLPAKLRVGVLHQHHADQPQLQVGHVELTTLDPLAEARLELLLNSRRRGKMVEQKQS